MEHLAAPAREPRAALRRYEIIIFTLRQEAAPSYSRNASSVEGARNAGVSDVSLLNRVARMSDQILYGRRAAPSSAAHPSSSEPKKLPHRRVEAGRRIFLQSQASSVVGR